jgi:hypothetical protein
MAKMFRDRVDENGVGISDNSHSAESYGHPLSEQRPAHPHWMAGEDGHGGYLEAPAKGIVHKTKDRMLTHLGRPPGAMTFDGDLLPRSERMTRQEAGPGPAAGEMHDPDCWCDLCHPMQSSVPSGPAKMYRR